MNNSITRLYDNPRTNPSPSGVNACTDKDEAVHEAQVIQSGLSITNRQNILSTLNLSGFSQDCVMYENNSFYIKPGEMVMVSGPEKGLMKMVSKVDLDIHISTTLSILVGVTEDGDDVVNPPVYPIVEVDPINHHHNIKFTVNCKNVFKPKKYDVAIDLKDFVDKEWTNIIGGHRKFGFHIDGVDKRFRVELLFGDSKVNPNIVNYDPTTDDVGYVPSTDPTQEFISDEPSVYLKTIAFMSVEDGFEFNVVDFKYTFPFKYEYTEDDFRVYSTYTLKDRSYTAVDVVGYAKTFPFGAVKGLGLNVEYPKYNNSDVPEYERTLKCVIFDKCDFIAANAPEEPVIPPVDPPVDPEPDPEEPVIPPVDPEPDPEEPVIPPVDPEPDPEEPVIPPVDPEVPALLSMKKLGGSVPSPSIVVDYDDKTMWMAYINYINDNHKWNHIKNLYITNSGSYEDFKHIWENARTTYVPLTQEQKSVLDKSMVQSMLLYNDHDFPILVNSLIYV